MNNIKTSHGVLIATLLFITAFAFYGMGFYDGKKAMKKEMKQTTSQTSTNDIEDTLRKLKEWQDNVNSNKFHNFGKKKNLWI